MSVTAKCQCEHESHFDFTKRSPDGNPNHRYGLLLYKEVLLSIKTLYGTFKVCPGCAEDCMANVNLAKGGTE